jgi:2'-5' RNA ligase
VTPPPGAAAVSSSARGAAAGSSARGSAKPSARGSAAGSSARGSAKPSARGAAAGSSARGSAKPSARGAAAGSSARGSAKPSARGSTEPSAPGPTLRLFVALELPGPALDALMRFRDVAADPAVWRPVPAESLHLTLAFLGRRPATDVPAVETVLRAAAGPAPRLALAGALLLPPRRARVLCAALTDLGGTLAELQARVSDGLAAAGLYTPEKRAYRAHATVARLRPRARPPRAIDTDPEPLEFTGEALTLFESRLHPHGARYEPLVRLRLAA